MSPDALKEWVTHAVGLLDLAVDSTEVSVGPASTTRPGRTTISIRSSDAELFIGPNGDHLRALNTLLRRMVEQKHGEEAANFLIDVNGYHEAQMESVRATARMFAQRARLFKREVEMEPMNPYERLVVHELFANDPDIETRSEGEGKFRHVVLAPR